MNEITDFDQIFASELSGTYLIAAAVFYVLIAVALWKVFSKAGYPGILAWIPVVNMIILVKIAGYSAWLVLLYLIPIVNVVFGIFVAMRLGGNFGKGGFFSFLWLWLFPVIGYFVLGYGQARYRRL